MAEFPLTQYRFKHGTATQFVPTSVELKSSAPAKTAVAPKSAVGDAIAVTQRSVVGEALHRVGEPFGKIALFVGTTAGGAGVGFALGTYATMLGDHWLPWGVMGAIAFGITSLIGAAASLDIVKAQEHDGVRSALGQRALLNGFIAGSALVVGGLTAMATGLGLPALIAGVIGATGASIISQEIETVSLERAKQRR